MWKSIVKNGILTDYFFHPDFIKSYVGKIQLYRPGEDGLRFDSIRLKSKVIYLPNYQTKPVYDVCQ